MSLFDAFGVSAADVNENPFQISKPNRYACILSESDVKEFGKDGEQKIPYWVNEYTINDGGENDGKSANSMHRLIPWTPEERMAANGGKDDSKAMNARLLSGYKKELMNLGIPVEAMNAFDPKNPAHRNKVIGLKGSAWFGPQKNNPEFNTMSEFQREEKAGTSSPSESNVVNSASGAGDIDMDALDGWD